MMRILGAVIAILLLLGAGAGGFWFVLGDRLSLPEGAAADDRPPAFVTLPVMTIPVIDGDRVTRTFVLQITLEVPDAVDKEVVEAAHPRLVDAFVTELHTLLARRLMERRGYDIGLMKLRLERAADRVLGPGHVRDILVRLISER